MKEDNEISDDEWADKLFEEKRREEKAILEQAIIEAEKIGKEKFDVEKLKKYWVIEEEGVSDLGLKKEYDRIKYQYYTTFKRIMTIEELAAHLKKLDKW